MLIFFDTESESWDWPWVFEIMGDRQTWTENLEGRPEILLFDADRGELFNMALERAFADGLRRHHALDDAKANRLGWLASGSDYDGE